MAANEISLPEFEFGLLIKPDGEIQQLEPPKNQRRVYALEEWRNYLDDCNMIEILCSPELDSITTVPASFKDPEKYLWIIDQDAEPKKKQVNSAFPTLFGSVVIVRKAYFCW